MTTVTGGPDEAGSARERPGAMPPGDLLLSFEGRIDRIRFCLGLLAVAVVLAATVLIFRLPEGMYCRMAPAGLAGRVYLAALAVMAIILLAMLAALCWKRMADIGWWRILALGPVLPAAAFPLAWRLEALGPCGAMTGERAVVVVWCGIAFVGALAIHFLGSRRRRPVEAPAAPAANTEDG